MTLWSERILVAMLERHAFPDRESVSWAELRTELLLLTRLDPGVAFEDVVRSNLVSQGGVQPSCATTSAAPASRGWSAWDTGHTAH